MQTLDAVASQDLVSAVTVDHMSTICAPVCVEARGIAIRRRPDTRAVVLFVDDEVWGTFTHLAIAVRRAGCAVVRVASTPARSTSRVVSALEYDEVIRLDRPEGARRLDELVDSGRIADLQVNERSWARLDQESAAGTLLRSVSAMSKLTLVDKVEAATLIRRISPARSSAVPRRHDRDKSTTL